MINILFVDDEPNILDGLQRMLRTMRREWRMTFAISGAEALHKLALEPIDVVVTDMKMPGMDGAQLLQEVRQRYPHIVRIVLSGYSEKELILKSVGSAHQYLAKPCDSEMLKATVSRACALRNLLIDANLRRLVSQMQTVPSLPTLYYELMQELHSSEPSLKKVGEIVKSDIGMTVKILQLVNSAFFGLQRHISDAGEAVTFLGLDTIMSLALAFGVFSQFEGIKPVNSVMSQLWAHSITVGGLARCIARRERSETAHDAFTAGLLHHIGSVVLAANLPQKFVQVESLMTCDKLTRSEAEMRVFATTYSSIGAYLLGLWGLPSPVVEAVAFHLTPGEYPSGSFTALTAVHIANVMQRAADPMITHDLPHHTYDYDYLARLGLIDKLAGWEQDCSRFAYAPNFSA